MEDHIKEYQAITTVLNTYADGLRTGNLAQLKQVFHQDAIMYGYWEQQFVEGRINNLYDSVSKYGSAPSLVAHIDILYKADNIALARVIYEKNAANKNGQDLHSLIKVDGQWKVIAKLFEIPL